MDLRICRYFLAIVEEGSMNRASRVLHITQPTLSRQIAQLEEDLHVRLFERRSKSLVLTPQGMLFARRAREMLELEAKMRGELQTTEHELKGRLQIGTGELAANHCLLEIISRFCARYPQIQISMVTGTADQCRELLENGLLDLAVFLNPVSLDHLHTHALNLREKWTAVMRRDHPLAALDQIRAQDLESEPLILPYRKEPGQIIENWLGRPIESLPSIHRSSLSANGALMVLHGLGILISISKSPSFASEELVEKPLDPEVSSSVVLAWKDRFPMPLVLDRFLKFLFEALDENSADKPDPDFSQ